MYICNPLSDQLLFLHRWSRFTFEGGCMEGVTVETWISPAFVDLTCICGFTSLIKATLPIRKLPQSEGESFDSAFLDSTLKKLLNLATKDYNLIP